MELVKFGKVFVWVHRFCAFSVVPYSFVNHWSYATFKQCCY